MLYKGRQKKRRKPDQQILVVESNKNFKTDRGQMEADSERENVL